MKKLVSIALSIMLGFLVVPIVPVNADDPQIEINQYNAGSIEEGTIGAGESLCFELSGGFSDGEYLLYVDVGFGRAGNGSGLQYRETYQDQLTSDDYDGAQELTFGKNTVIFTPYDYDNVDDTKVLEFHNSNNRELDYTFEILKLKSSNDYYNDNDDYDDYDDYYDWDDYDDYDDYDDENTNENTNETSYTLGKFAYNTLQNGAILYDVDYDYDLDWDEEDNYVIYAENYADEYKIDFLILGSDNEVQSDARGNRCITLEPDEGRNVRYDFSSFSYDDYDSVTPKVLAVYSLDNAENYTNYDAGDNNEDDYDWTDDPGDYDDYDDWDDYDDYDGYDDYDDEEEMDFGFTITPCNLSCFEIDGVSDKTYTGKELTQNTDVYYGDTELLIWAEYSTTYSNNKNVGTATVTAKGKYPFKGTIKKTFKINPKGTSLTKATGAKRAIAVTWKKQTARMSKSRINGYQIQYGTKSNFKGAKTATVSGYNKASKTITKLSGKKKYYVRIRTYMKVGSKTYYSPWSASKAVTTKQ